MSLQFGDNSSLSSSTLLPSFYIPPFSDRSGRNRSSNIFSDCIRNEESEDYEFGYDNDQTDENDAGDDDDCDDDEEFGEFDEYYQSRLQNIQNHTRSFFIVEMIDTLQGQLTHELNSSTSDTNADSENNHNIDELFSQTLSYFDDDTQTHKGEKKEEAKTNTPVVSSKDQKGLCKVSILQQRTVEEFISLKIFTHKNRLQTHLQEVFILLF